MPSRNARFKRVNALRFTGKACVCVGDDVGDAAQMHRRTHTHIHPIVTINGKTLAKSHGINTIWTRKVEHHRARFGGKKSWLPSAETCTTLAPQRNGFESSKTLVKTALNLHRSLYALVRYAGYGGAFPKACTTLFASTPPPTSFDGVSQNVSISTLFPNRFQLRSVEWSCETIVSIGGIFSGTKWHLCENSDIVMMNDAV